MTKRNRLNGVGMSGVLLAGVLALTACSGTSHPTCSEYAAMSSSTGLLDLPSSQQEDALREYLRHHDRSASVLQLPAAHLEVISFCNIYDGQAGNNGARPITDAS